MLFRCHQQLVKRKKTPGINATRVREAKILVLNSLWYAGCNEGNRFSVQTGLGNLTTNHSMVRENLLMFSNLNFVYYLVACGLLATFCANNVDGQTTSKNQIVAVLDVAKVFKANEQFNQQMEDLRAEANAKQAEIAAELKNVDDPKKKGKTAKEISAQISTELIEREAQIYTTTYDSMQKVVEEVAEEHGIVLVIRADTTLDGLDATEEHRATKTKPATNHRAVLKRINSNVIYHRKLDLTNLVIERLSKLSDVSTAERCDKCGQVIEDAGHLHK